MGSEHDAADAHDFWRYSTIIRQAQRDYADGVVSLTAMLQTMAEYAEELEIVADVTSSDAVRRRCYDFLSATALESFNATA